MISEQEWNSIREAAMKIAAEVAGRRVEWLKTGIVVKRDEDDRLIWIKDMADIAIPIVAHDYDLRYYDTDENGAAIVRHARAKIVVPKIGQSVLIAFELGSSRLPRCLGVIQGTNWIEEEE